jgi:hypothetical protein
MSQEHKAHDRFLMATVLGCKMYNTSFGKSTGAIYRQLRMMNRGFTMGSSGFGNIFGDVTDEQIELDLLKGALLNPDLFASVKEVFHNHPNPDALDPTGRRIYEIFKRLESSKDIP